MKALTPDRVVGWLQPRFVSLRQQRFFSDRLTLSILIPTLILNGITLIILLSKVRPTDFAVPARYSNLNGFDALGPWYGIYKIGLFGLIVTSVNTVLAMASFGRSRIASFFLVAGAFVVALFCLIIGTAFAVII